MDGKTTLATLRRLCRALDDGWGSGVRRALVPLAAPAALGLGLGLADCALLYGAPPDEPRPVELCGDRADNDGDGRVDCDDPDCLSQPGCPAPVYAAPPVAEICGDGVDNDTNGRADCADPACASQPGCQVPVYGLPPMAEVCGDGVDNNANNLVDCADPACAGQPSCLGALPRTPMPDPAANLYGAPFPNAPAPPQPPGPGAPDPGPTPTAYGAPFGGN